MSDQPTPGEWVAVSPTRWHTYVRADDDCLVAACQGPDRHANSRLIAKAKEMRELLAEGRDDMLKHAKIAAYAGDAKANAHLRERVDRINAVLAETKEAPNG